MRYRDRVFTAGLRSLDDEQHLVRLNCGD